MRKRQDQRFANTSNPTSACLVPRALQCAHRGDGYRPAKPSSSASRRRKSRKVARRKQCHIHHFLHSTGKTPGRPAPAEDRHRQRRQVAHQCNLLGARRAARSWPPRLGGATFLRTSSASNRVMSGRDDGREGREEVRQREQPLGRDLKPARQLTMRYDARSSRLAS